MSKLISSCTDILPYEKCLLYGPQVLSNEELLAVIIRTGTHNSNCLDTSRTLLKSFGSMGLLGLKHAKVSDMTAIEGIGTVKAVMLNCIGEISARISKAAIGNSNCFTSSSDIADYYMEELRHLEKEHFILMHLNNKCRLLHETVLSIGTVNQTCVSARDIFKDALNHGAVYLIVVHNHPSGDPAPSSEDIETTRVIAAAGQIIGIPLIDHIIIGDNKYISFKEENML